VDAVPERQVAIGRPVNVQALRIGKDGGIMVSGEVPRMHHRIGRNALSAELHISRGATEREPDGWQVAQHLFDRGRNQLRLRAEFRLQLRILGQEIDPVRNQIFRGFLARGEQQDTEFDELTVAEVGAVHLGHAERAQDIPAWGFPPRS
jgi:hypothetical protein